MGTTPEPIKSVNRGNAGKGRPKGSQNKLTRSVRESILAAFDEVGGAEYLVAQAHKNPVAFLTLLSRVIPTKMDHKIKGEMTKTFVFRIHKPGEPFPIPEAGEEDREAN